MIKRSYLVSYSHMTDDSFGYGSATLTFRKKLGVRHLDRVKELLEEEPKFKNVVILNVVRMGR